MVSIGSLGDQISITCAQTGHSWCIAPPLMVVLASQKVFCKCENCGFEVWIKLPPLGFQKLLKHAADGEFGAFCML